MAIITAHFAQLDSSERTRLFQHEPQPVAEDAGAQPRALALGATLYTPGTRPDLPLDVSKAHDAGARSQVLCLEDSIADHEVEWAQANVIAALRTLDEVGVGHQVFVRVRQPEQITQIAGELDRRTGALAGFVLPKFNACNGADYLDAVADASQAAGRVLWGMPVLETRDIIYRELRTEALLDLRRIVDKHRELVLALRIGATDLSSLYGLRRRPDVTLWDVGVVASAISDVVNAFGRVPTDGEPDTMVITGPVWEYFNSPPQLLRTQLRSTPFVDHRADDVRAALMAAHQDGLIREAVLDRVNGLTGKTVIHPSHVHPLHALYAVTAEEHADAQDIVAASEAGGGVVRSEARNKMNEAGPHYAWARRTLMLGSLFGVLRPEMTYVDLLAAGRPA